MSVNKVILIGNLGADPEIKVLDGGRKVANLRLATNESYTDKSGNRVTQTEWHNLEIWGKLAEIAEQYLKKGTQIYAEGRIRTDSWQDQEGNTRYMTRIRVNTFTILGSKGPSEPDSGSPTGGKHQAPPPEPPEEDDDLPF